MTRPDRDHSPRAVSALPFAVLAVAAIGSACIQHSVESKPIEIKPIHITMDINLRVQRELDEFFDFETPAPSPADATTTPKTESGME